MTAMEALSIVHSEQGFLIMGCRCEKSENEIIQSPTAVWTTDEDGNFRSTEVSHPVQVIDSATPEQFLQQNSRLAALIGCPDHQECMHRYFYKVVALD